MYLFRFLFFAWAGVLAAQGGTVSFTFPGKNESKTIEVATVEVNRVSYVLLTDLVSKAGGDCRIDRENVEVNLGGSTALISRGDTEVNASSGRFTLRHPLLVNDGIARMALSDIVPFFGSGFRISVTQRAAEELSETPQAKSTTAPAGSATEESTATDTQGSEIQLVVIDPGHGGNDAGAVGPAGVKEKDVTLAIAKRLEEVLRASYGVQTLLMRQEDVAMTVEKRVSVANVKRGSLLVSIHAGAGLSSTMIGIQVFHGGEAPKSAAGTKAVSVLAETVAASAGAATSAPLRGVHAAACRVFKGLRMPGIQVEAGVLTTPGEETLLADGGYQQKIAEGIAKGIMQYAGGAQ